MILVQEDAEWVVREGVHPKDMIATTQSVVRSHSHIGRRSK